MLLSAAMQPLNQLGTKGPVQAVSCPFLGSLALAVLIGMTEQSGLASHPLASVPVGVGTWPSSLEGQGREGEAGRGAGT